ncbi:MAG TPA: (Fe-S)-binding protein, partial [Rariglobus sp.]
MALWQSVNLFLFAVVVAYALYCFGHVVHARYTYIRLGRPVEWEENWRARFHAILTNVFGQQKLLKDKKSGLMHIVMFYGFIIVQFGAIELIGKGLVPQWQLPVPGHAAFTLSQEITVGLILLAVLYAAYRRFGEKLPRLKRSWKASLVLWFIGLLMLSVLFALAFEQVRYGHAPSPFTPLSSLLARGMAGLSPAAAGVGFAVSWWVHLLILLTFLVYIPQSKHFHLITGPVNTWLQRLGPTGKLAPIDFEDESAESYGVGRVEDFTQKQLIDLYACVECGRCTHMCPASGTGKLLSPMDLIVKLRDHLTEKGEAVTSRRAWMPDHLFGGGGVQLAAAGPAAREGAATAEREYPIQLIGDVISEQEIWACTTCRNCEDQCPVMNEHVDKIIDLRRYLVLTQGQMPAEASRTFQNIERQGNPWGLARSERADWIGEARRE